MVHTIRVDQVLREAVATPYRDLVTRTTGAAVRTGIERAILADHGSTTLLDFSAVGLVDFSCADEVVAKLLLGVLPAGRYLVLLGINEDHSEAIDHVLRHQDLAVLVTDDEAGPCRTLGLLSDDLLQALEQVQRRGGLDVSALAAAAEWTLERAAQALERLTLLRLVMAEALTYSPVPIA
ncbi:MAG: hypothetical protein ABJC74_13710 [Gemmatimonadota bacterium]